MTYPLKLRVLLSFSLIIVSVTAKTLPLAAINLVLGALLLLYFHIPVKFVVKRVLFVFPFFIFSALMLVIVDGQIGLEKAELFTLRLLFVAMMLAFLFYQLATDAFLKVLRQLKVPAIFVELAFFTLRFVDVFRVEARNMTLSIRSKGFRPKKIFNYKEVKVVGQLLGSMLVRTLARSDRIYLGMLSRGYKMQELEIPRESVPARSWVLFVLLVSVMVVVQIVYYLYT